MQKAIKKFLNSGIIMAAAFIILGLVFIMFPEGSLDVIRWIIALFFLASGAYMLASNLASNRAPFFGATMMGVILLIGGLVFAVNPSVMDIFPIVLGAWFIISSLSTVRYSTALVGSSAGVWATLSSILSIVCGIILIINPWGGQIAMMTFAGIMMLIYAVASLIDLITIKRNLHDLSKKFDNLLEGEVVEKKSAKKASKK